MKSFILIELIVVLALSSVVISVAWLSTDIIIKQFNYHRNKSDENLRLQELDYLLKWDIERSRLVTRKGDELEFEIDDSMSVSYWVMDVMIRSIIGRRDTFDVPVRGMRTQFNKMPRQDGLIDEVTILLENDIVLIYGKNYAADVLIKTQ